MGETDKVATGDKPLDSYWAVGSPNMVEPHTPLDATAIARKVNEFRNAIGVLDAVGEKVTAIYAQSLLDYLSVRG